MPFVTIAELRAGFSLGTKGRENEKVLPLFLTLPGELDPSRATERYGKAMTFEYQNFNTAT